MNKNLCPFSIVSNIGSGELPKYIFLSTQMDKGFCSSMNSDSVYNFFYHFIPP